MRGALHGLAAIWLVAASGCTDARDDGATDAGADASGVDASGPDASVPDGSAPDASSPDGSSPDAGPCTDHAGCGFGEVCDGGCLAVECHLGRYDGGVPDKPCPDGRRCQLQDGGLDYLGSCVAFDTGCAFNEDCPFGYLCRGGSCRLAECTVGQPQAGYGPRPCTVSGEVCRCMEDGVDINGGRGQCVGVSDECL